MANKEGGGASKEPGTEGTASRCARRFEGAGICGLIIAGYGSITAKDHRIDTIPAFDVTSVDHA